jgi:predicted permease
VLARLSSFCKAVTGRGRLESDMDAEMRFHLDAFTNDLIRSGVPVDEARRRARMEFGSSERAKEECRESRGLRLTDEFARNVRYAIRSFRKTPGFTIAAVLTLALCIGANTAIFSVIDAALLRPLPYPEPERLAQVVAAFRSKHAEGVETGQDGYTWQMLSDNARRIQLAGMGFGFTGVNLAANGKAQYVEQSRVTAGYFRVIGVPPFIGREFTKEEDAPNGPQAVVLSHALWTRVFGSDPAIAGKTVLLRGEPHTVVGVMPAGFHPVVQADLWTPLRPTRNGEGSGTNYEFFARLEPGSTLPQASAEVEALGQRILETDKQFDKDAQVRFGLETMQESLGANVRRPLLILWTAVAMVLLIGCLNISGLMLVRATARTREMATRVALGGGQGAVIRQLLTESLVLAVAGGAAGAAVGYFGIQALSKYASDALGIWQDMRMDWRVVAATAVLSLAASILFGLFPAMKAARLDVRSGLTEGGARGIAGAASRWPRRVLVLADVTLGMVLLVGAGLLIRTFLNLRQLSPGFDGNNVVAASLSLQDARYTANENVNRLFKESIDRITAMPAVESAAVALTLPYERWLNMGFRRVRDTGTDKNSTITGMNYITPDFFRVLRIPVLAGRAFDARDTADSAPVAIVNNAFARQYLKDTEPIGTYIRLNGAKGPQQIVGIVGDVQQKPGWDAQIPLATQPAAYVPATQMTAFKLIHTWFAPKWVVRTASPRQAVITGMQRAVEQTDPLLPFASFKTLDDFRDSSIATHRFQAALLGALSGLALLLAAIGIYGLIANSAAQRAREMGIRMALGASAGRVIGSVAMPGLALSAAGVVAGLALSAVAVRAMRSIVFGIAVFDMPTFAAVGLILLTVATAASLIPALRIARLNPASTLRDE